MAKEKKIPVIDKENCAGCSLCVENCPNDVLAISMPKFKGDIRTVAEIKDLESCIGCGLCKKACPIDAITMIYKAPVIG